MMIVEVGRWERGDWKGKIDGKMGEIGGGKQRRRREKGRMEMKMGDC
jgi:hypothetical protein